jgi:sugar phosphate isomerase/epimerase
LERIAARVPRALEKDVTLVTRAVATVSLNRTLGRYSAPDASVDGGRLHRHEPDPNGLPLLDLPAELRNRGYEALQVSHFHIPTRDPSYLAELRSALAENEIALDTILVDDGDLTHPTDAARHETWISGWIATAQELGAARARICAGRQQPTPETLKKSGEGMARLAASHAGYRVVTENWMEMLPNLTAYQAVREITGDSVGLLFDFGNWKEPDWYEQLAQIAPLAETCHAKCHFTLDGPNREDYQRALGLLKDVDYDGPIVLIYLGPDNDEWSCLDTEWEIVQTVFEDAPALAG